MAIQFGKTWWGEHWLRSLQNVDYDNRLPRGASYARNGYVKDVKIKGNHIAAKVAGSRPRPYNVTIIVPPFFEEQVEALMNGIVGRPALSKLLTVSKKKVPVYDEEKAYQRVDFSRLKDISNAVALLLPDSPPFYSSGNFREKINEQFTRNARDSRRILSKKLSLEALYPSAIQEATINYHTTLSYLINSNNQTDIMGENHSFNSNSQLFPALFSLNPDRLPDYQPSVAAFYKILLASFHLIANGNVVPQIVQLENKQYIIRWLPTTIDAEVRLLIEKLVDILPPNLFLILKETGKTRQVLPLENQVQELFSVFITEVIS